MISLFLAIGNQLLSIKEMKQSVTIGVVACTSKYKGFSCGFCNVFAVVARTAYHLKAVIAATPDFDEPITVAVNIILSEIESLVMNLLCYVDILSK